MKDVAILTKFYKNYNYGGMLQGYALQRVISDLGYTADIVSYDVKKNANSVYPSIIVQAKQYGAKAAAAKVGEKAIGKGKVFIKDIISDRTEKFTQFMTDTDAGTEVYSDDTMYLLTSRYKTFVSGSDQVWNPNAVRNLYLQTFSAVSGRKISYAASIGRDELSEFEANAMIPSLRQFGSISVRENTAKALLEKYIDTPITTVLDPTMLLSADDWAEIAAERAVKGRYAVVYFFSDSLKVRRESEAFCKKHGLELIMIPYAKQEYNLTDKKGPGIRSDRVGPNEFVSLIRNADFVITDSFHGAVFSLIHRIPFAVFERNKAGHVSMNSRLYDLLDTFDESRRLIDVSRIDELDGLIEIDKEKIRRVMEERKAESLSFLKNAIEKGIAAYEREEALVTVTGRESSCSGCGACAELCPRKCITIRPNDNGFNVPVIHTEQCIRCGKCRRVCPMLGNYQGSESIKAYGAYAKKEEPKSASGGLSYLISSEFIRSGGAVYGASYADDLRVRIERAACIDQLASFQGSKYVQADMGDSLSKAANDLRAGKRVLFTGTPCEIAGVKAMAKEQKLEENLYTAEIICHGTPSPQMFEDYLLWAEKHYGKKIVSFSFRAKSKDTDKDFLIRFGFSDGSERTVSGFKDPYYKLFLSARWFRMSCYECPFASDKRAADITLGDFWNSEKLPGRFGKGRRISVVLVNTDKGQAMMDSVRNKAEWFETTRDIARAGNANLYRPTRKYAGYVGYGAKGSAIIEAEAGKNIDKKKYVFNQMPLGMRRAVKRIFGKA